MATTPAQIRANRTNAKKSSGPITPKGKSKSAQNHLKHGFRGQFRIIHDEDPNAYKALLAALQNEHQPATPTETILVERMAEHHWLAQRAQFLQSSLFTGEHFNRPTQKLFELYLRYETANNRGFFKCLNELARLRNDKLKQQIGFERQKRQAADEARKQEAHEAGTSIAKAGANHQNRVFNVKDFVKTCLPTHPGIPFSVLESILTSSIERISSQLAPIPGLSQNQQVA